MPVCHRFAILHGLFSKMKSASLAFADRAIDTLVARPFFHVFSASARHVRRSGVFEPNSGILSFPHQTPLAFSRREGCRRQKAVT
jgi:hypothetical protein